MITLSATNTIITVNSNTFPKNSLMFQRRDDTESVKIIHSTKGGVVVGWTNVSDVVIDGVPTATYQEVIGWIENNFFVDASSNGEAVPVETEASIKEKYESNLNTNAFTDDDKSNLGDLSLHPPLTNNPHQVTAEQVGLGKVNNTSDAEKEVSDLAKIELAKKQDLSEKGQAGGYPELGADGLIPINYINVSGLQFLGAWDVDTNTPELNNGQGNVGDFYKVQQVDGTGEYDFGNGVFTFKEGDWVIYAAGVWQRLGSSDSVSMVNGKVGAVVITKSDLDLQFVDNTADLDKPVSNAANIEFGKKQDTLISGSNIKTINGQSLLGSGDISIIGGMAPITTSFVNGVTHKEFSNRNEYIFKASVPSTDYTANQRRTYPTNSTFPIAFNDADEHYISVFNSSRVVNAVAYLNGENSARIGAVNTIGNNALGVQIKVFIKLVKFK